MNRRSMHDVGVVRLLRAGFRWWPFMRGRGWLLRLSRLLLGPGPVRFDIGGGAAIEGSLDDWMILWTFMCLHERDEPFQRSLGFLPSAAVAFDVGAHVGVWSLLAATHNPAARIHAFEPVPAIVERLRHHAQINGADQVVINGAAAGAENGSLPFVAVQDRNTGASSFYRRHEAGVEMRVPVVMLDTYVEQERIGDVDLIKADVEGAEILVFKGAAGLLSSDRAPVIFFEVNEELCARCGVTGRDVKQLLVDHGYRIFRWRGGAFSSVAVEETHRHEDLFALKPRHMTQLRPRTDTDQHGTDSA